MGKQTTEVSRLVSESLGRRITPDLLREYIRLGKIREPHRLSGCGHYLWFDEDIKNAVVALSGSRWPSR